MDLANKTILVTGGTGSFGQKLVEIALRECNPRAIRIFSRGEHKQLEMQQRLDSDRLRFFIGDVRDRDRLHRAMYGVDVVVHAAALKQITLAEYNPIEAVKTNILGAVNIIDAAIDCGVEKVMGISTDKAVHPVNLYGATKLVAEKLFVQGNAYTGDRGTRFGCVRYGNVIGSQGSVFSVFLKQREIGTLTITDPRMTRFWITINQGVRFVLKCIEWMKGGEIFVPKIPSMRVVDFAETIAPEAGKTFVGIRPGEKLDEILLTEEEARHSKEFDDYYVIEPEHSFWKTDARGGGQPLPEDFRHTSANNSRWLTKEELARLVKDLQSL